MSDGTPAALAATQPPSGGAPLDGTAPSRHHHKHHKKHGNPHSHKGEIPAPRLAYEYINFRGYGFYRRDGLAVLCGDAPPTITGGYAKWKIVDRPLMVGVPVFQGYDPVTMKISLRFGKWDHEGWHVDEDTGIWVETQIEILEWMSGARIGAGQSPLVYVNTYGPKGRTTNLIPYEYQTTVGAVGSRVDTYMWPWVINGGVQWGQSWRSRVGSNRVYQDAEVTLTQFTGFNPPPQSSANGQYFTTTKKVNDCLLIAQQTQFHALDITGLAKSIQKDKHNNPITGTKIHLQDHHLRWKIPDHKQVWVPAHTV